MYRLLALDLDGTLLTPPPHHIGAGDPRLQAWGGMRPLLSVLDHRLTCMICYVHG